MRYLCLLLPLWLWAIRVLPAGAASIAIPQVFTDEALLLPVLETPADARAVTVTLGGSVAGDTNVGSLWELSDDGQPSRRFTDTDGQAELQYGGWLRVGTRRWWVGYGQGSREVYTGNRDAAQLWLDLHAAGATQPRYAPVAHAERVDVTWYGLGHTVPLRAGAVQGEGTLLLRRLCATDLLQQAVVGEVEDDRYTGMLKVRNASAAGETVDGDGWSLDTRLQLAWGARWHAQATVEGLLGNITWRQLPVEDGYLVSPRVFTDADGFLRDIGGISGALWREDVTLDITPSYQVEVLARTRPNLLAGIQGRRGGEGVPMLGVAWPQRGWVPYARLYPSQEVLEVGAVGRGWQLRLSGDDWLLKDPCHARLSLAVQAISF